MQNECKEFIYNLTYPEDLSIKKVALIIKNVIGYDGEFSFDLDKPEGVKSKRICIERIEKLRFTPKTNLKDGIEKTYLEFLEEIKLKKIKKIIKSEHDINIYTQILSNVTNSFKQPMDYKNKVVLKPWGHEYLIYENKHVAVWFLKIKNDFSTSMHCHPLKKTSLILIDGKIFCNTFSEKTYLEGSDAIIFEKGVFHSTKGLDKDGSYIIEIESPPNKTDLVRLSDRYGRENSGYEGTTDMIEDNLIEKFNYFDFFDSDAHILNNKLLTFEIYDSYTIKNFKCFDNEIVISCEGTLVNEKDHILLEVGDCEYGYKLYIDTNTKIIGSKQLKIIRLKVLNEK